MTKKFGPKGDGVLFPHDKQHDKQVSGVDQGAPHADCEGCPYRQARTSGDDAFTCAIRCLQYSSRGWE